MEESSRPIVFSPEDYSDLREALGVLRRADIAHSREALVRAVDKHGGVIGLRGIGPKRAPVLEKALALGPGRWAKLLELAPYDYRYFPTTEAEIYQDAPELPDLIIMLFAAGDYPGGGIYDYVRGFRGPQARDEAKAYFTQWVSAGDMNPRDVTAHIAALDVWTGGVWVLERWDEVTLPSGDYKEWAEVPDPREWGRYLDKITVDSGSHDFYPVPELKDLTATPRELFPELSTTDGESGDN